MNMDIRTTAARIEMLRNMIDSKTSTAEKLRAKLTDPRLSSLDSDRGQRDYMKRQRMMTDYLDRVAQIEREIEPLQAELDDLRAELRDYLEHEQVDGRTRQIIRMHLLHGFTWVEISKIPGFKSISLCKKIYMNWLESIGSING